MTDLNWLDLKILDAHKGLQAIAQAQPDFMAGCQTHTTYVPIEKAILSGELARVELRCNGKETSVSASICNSNPFVPSQSQLPVNSVLFTTIIPPATNSTTKLAGELFAYGPCVRRSGQLALDMCAHSESTALDSSDRMFSNLPLLCCPLGQLFIHENSSTGFVPKCTHRVDALLTSAQSGEISKSLSFWKIPFFHRWAGILTSTNEADVAKLTALYATNKIPNFRTSYEDSRVYVGFSSQQVCITAGAYMLVPTALYKKYAAETDPEKKIDMEIYFNNTYSPFISCTKKTGGVWIPELTVSVNETAFEKKLEELKQSSSTSLPQSSTQTPSSSALIDSAVDNGESTSEQLSLTSEALAQQNQTALVFGGMLLLMMAMCCLIVIAAYALRSSPDRTK